MKAKIKMGDREYEGELTIKRLSRSDCLFWGFRGDNAPFISGLSFNSLDDALADAKAHNITIEE